MKKLIGLIIGMALAGGIFMASADEVSNTQFEKATFAGGCFWCMTPPFRQLKGVQSVKAGYTGGHMVNPTYEDVCTGTTGHAESVQIVYDPKQITYDELLEVFWRNIDPTQQDGQFADHGSQYRTAIFYHTPEQKRLAELSKEKLQKSGKFKTPIVTEITPASTFYVAEDYHQDYSLKNPMHYKMYRMGSGRADYIKKTWGADDH